MNRRQFLQSTGAAIGPALMDPPTEASHPPIKLPPLKLPPLDAVKAELASRRLLPFVEMHWSVVEPRTLFRNNWHIGALCEHLEAITLGQLGDALINIPPGCMKSYLVAVFWPAWEWGPRNLPHYRYLCGSYDEALSIRDNLRSRDIIRSQTYQRHWPLKLRADQDMKTQYWNQHSGWRIATSVGGKGTGEHPHRKIIDDPHNVKQSLSEVQRKEAITWFDLTMGSRGLALGAVTVVIMQRLHEDDLSGHILAKLRDQFTHICLPMRYEPPAWVEVNGTKRLEPRMPDTPLAWNDERITSGELLWPALFDDETVAKLEAQLSAEHGEYGIAGQLQQRPVPQTGGLIKREWFEIIDAIPKDEGIVARSRGWDCAATEGDGDFTVGVKMALAKSGLVYVEHVVRGQWGPEHFEGPNGIFKQTVEADGRTVRQREEQEPGSAGKKVIRAHSLLLTGFDYRGEPSTGDKVTRNAPFRASASQRNVKLIRGPWNQEYLDVLCVFPNGKHDDDVDASSTAFNDVTLGPQTPSMKVSGMGVERTSPWTGGAI